MFNDDTGMLDLTFDPGPKHSTPVKESSENAHRRRPKSSLSSNCSVQRSSVFQTSKPSPCALDAMKAPTHTQDRSNSNLRPAYPIAGNVSKITALQGTHKDADSLVCQQRQEIASLMTELKERDQELNELVRSHQQQLTVWEQDRQLILRLQHKCNRQAAELKQHKEQAVRQSGKRDGSEGSILSGDVTPNSSSSDQSSVHLQQLQNHNDNLNDSLKQATLAKGQLQAREQELLTLLKLKEDTLSTTERQLGELKAQVKGLQLEKDNGQSEDRQLAEFWQQRCHALQTEHDKVLGACQEKDRQLQQATSQLEDTLQQALVLQQALAISCEQEKNKEELLASGRARQERLVVELNQLRALYKCQNREMTLLQLTLDTSKESEPEASDSDRHPALQPVPMSDTSLSNNSDAPSSLPHTHPSPSSLPHTHPSPSTLPHPLPTHCGADTRQQERLSGNFVQHAKMSCDCVCLDDDVDNTCDHNQSPHRDSSGSRVGCCGSSAQCSTHSGAQVVQNEEYGSHTTGYTNTPHVGQYDKGSNSYTESCNALYSSNRSHSNNHAKRLQCSSRTKGQTHQYDTHSTSPTNTPHKDQYITHPDNIPYNEYCTRTNSHRNTPPITQSSVHTDKQSYDKKEHKHHTASSFNIRSRSTDFGDHTQNTNSNNQTNSTSSPKCECIECCNSSIHVCRNRRETPPQDPSPVHQGDGSGLGNSEDKFDTGSKVHDVDTEAFWQKILSVRHGNQNNVQEAKSLTQSPTKEWLTDDHLHKEPDFTRPDGKHGGHYCQINPQKTYPRQNVSCPQLQNNSPPCKETDTTTRLCASHSESQRASVQGVHTPRDSHPQQYHPQQSRNVEHVSTSQTLNRVSTSQASKHVVTSQTSGKRGDLGESSVFNDHVFQSQVHCQPHTPRQTHPQSCDVPPNSDLHTPCRWRSDRHEDTATRCQEMELSGPQDLEADRGAAASSQFDEKLSSFLDSPDNNASFDFPGSQGSCSPASKLHRLLKESQDMITALGVGTKPDYH